jgi:cobaltochelatase CobS
MHEVFGLGDVAAAKNGRGDPIQISVLEAHEHSAFVPDDDPEHVWDIDTLKNILMAIELNIPLYLWGHTGTGKTTSLLQVCARTNRPVIRVQHTINTEESHIVGQWVSRAGETMFELGPLPMAMIHGWVYIADEYDFGSPAVLSVYQAVLEGKSLVIKEADGPNRITKPHPEFRFFANGNTNGNGDETGLYQGTSIQNHANYDRFGMVIETKYMSQELEAQIIVNKAKISKQDAMKLVTFATTVREAYAGNKLSSTISPRTLVFAANLGKRKGSWRSGIALSFSNKLSRVDREVVDGFAQRTFPS